MNFNKFYLTIFSIFIFKPPNKNEVSGDISNISHAGITRGVPGQKPNYLVTSVFLGAKPI